MMSLTRISYAWAAAVALLGSGALKVHAHEALSEKPSLASDGRAAQPACVIMENYRDLLAQGTRGDCPTEGICDEPEVRDGYLHTPGDPIKTIRVAINIFCRTNGLQCLATEEQGWQGIDILNNDFAPYGIQFEGVVRFANQSQYRVFDGQDDNPMKIAFAYDPEHYLNIFVVMTGGYSYGYFPWFDDPTGPLGGVVLDYTHLPISIISHEVGHNLGLWHTHHGVSEVNDCDPCYERVNGDRDRTGDFCAETPATPVHFDCPTLTGNDCEGTPWAPIDTANIMGYSTFCYDHFSAQQAARMHCWIEDKLTTWVVCDGDVDGNLIVDIEDVAAVISNWGAVGAGVTGDVNGDEIVDIQDLAAVLSAFGKACA